MKNLLVLFLFIPSFIWAQENAPIEEGKMTPSKDLLVSSDGVGGALQFCDPGTLNPTPVLSGGRVRPYITHAKEAVKYITGKSKIGEHSASTAYCMLSFESMGIPSQLEVMVRVDHVKAKKLLGLNEDQKTMKMAALIDERQNLQLELSKQKRTTPYKKEIERLLSKTGLYLHVTSGKHWTFPVVSGEEVSWLALPEFLTKERVESMASMSQTPVISAITKATNQFEQLGQGKVGGFFKHQIEYQYEKSHLFHFSMMFTLLALIFFGLGNKWHLGSILFGLSWFSQLIGITVRVLISGRAPITNMYETVLFSGFAAATLGLIIYFIRKEKIYITGGLAYNFLTLMMINFAHGMLSPSISPLVPVLRDNFWLSTHVTCIIVSYSALALSWILSNIVMVKKRFGKLTKKEFNHQVDLIYTCLKYGVVLLGAGIILGGVWADYSWGRFWGWDPKETWSFIALLIYMAILHGKYTSWITTERFVPMVATAFLSIMFAWFGVNYILAAGLHSYGFSEGGAVFLISFFLAQFAIIGVTQFGNKTKSLTA